MSNINDIGIHKNYIHIRLETYLTMPEEISGLRKEVRWNLNHQVVS